MLTEEERAELVAEVERDEWDPSKWEVVSSVRPVVVEVEMYPAEVVAIDRKAVSQGKTRDQLFRELAYA